jgi:hypothetical protein
MTIDFKALYIQSIFDLFSTKRIMEFALGQFTLCHQPMDSGVAFTFNDDVTDSYNDFSLHMISKEIQDFSLGLGKRIVDGVKILTAIKTWQNWN